MNHHGDHYVICDICGCKFRKSQVYIVNDRFNTQYRMVVCRKDYDETNPQAYPHIIKERLVRDTQKIRPELPDVSVINPNSSRLPSKPRNVRAVVDLLTNKVRITWDGSADIGTDGIIGWTLTRAEPQNAYQFLLVDNTNNPAPTWLDETSDITSTYTYEVAAISVLGTGEFSDKGYYPTPLIPDNISFLTVSQTNYVLTTGDGRAIIASD